MAQYFTGKILKTFSLGVAALKVFFSGSLRKILDPEELLA